MPQQTNWTYFISIGNYTEIREYTVFSSTNRTFSRIDDILGHKTSLNRFKMIEIISRIFSDHTGMKLEINHRNKSRKRMNTWTIQNDTEKPTSQ